MKLLSKIIEFAKQRTICKTAHYPFDCQTLAKALSLLFKQGLCKCLTVKWIVRCFANSMILLSNFIDFTQQFH